MKEIDVADKACLKEQSEQLICNKFSQNSGDAWTLNVMATLLVLVPIIYSL